jgi:hypothetical protein
VSRWGTHIGSNEIPYKRRLTATNSLPTNQVINDSSKSTTVSNNMKQTENELNENNTNIMNNSDSRRYSLAPIASKDEQAELIRKQKAKLERHYRRSTQAVSYEDIKSAEATIKATLNNNSESNIHTVDSTLILSQKALQASQQQVPPLPNQPPPYINNTTLTNTAKTAFSINNYNNETTNSSGDIQSASPILSSNSVESISERDAIIAKDIETDKLLNAIEKSKGFSDVYSTTRRLRNRSQGLNQVSLFDRLNGINDSNSTSPSSFAITSSNSVNNSAPKKINKLIWNEDKLEVEFRDKDETLIEQQQLTNTTATTTASLLQTNTMDNDNSIVKRQYSVPDGRQIQTQLNIIGSKSNNIGGHSSRLKLSTNDNDNSSFNNRVNVKRSVSQVPISTSERYYPMSSSSSRLTSPNVSSNINDNKIVRFLDFYVK